MKNWIYSLLLLGAAFTFTGCNDTKQVSGEEFVKLAGIPYGTMRFSEVVGIKEDKAVLRVSEMSLLNKRKWKDTYYYADLTDLPEDWKKANIPAPQE